MSCFFIFLLTGKLFSEETTRAPLLELDILLAKHVQEIFIVGLDLQREIYSYQGIRSVSKKNNHKVSEQNRKGLKLNCRSLMKTKTSGKGFSEQLLATVNSPSGILNWNGEKFKGSFLIYGPDQKGLCSLVNRLDIEKYLSLVLPKEMNAAWPLEALKAQAVAGRTYALYQKQMRQLQNLQQNLKGKNKRSSDLENSEKYQVNGSLFDETSNTAYVAKSTSGEVLVLSHERGNGGNSELNNRQANITPIFFHASCGGKTLLPGDVWENFLPGYERVECPICAKRKDDHWSFKFRESEMLKILKKHQILQNISGELNVNLIGHNNSFDDHKIDLEIINTRTSASQRISLRKSLLRQYFGVEVLMSNRFTISKQKPLWSISGEGRGHGVGMCQLGALELAKQGWDYTKILKYFFPHHVIVRNYGMEDEQK